MSDWSRLFGALPSGRGGGGGSSSGSVNLTGVVRSVNHVTPDSAGDVEITVVGGGGATSAAAVTYSPVTGGMDPLSATDLQAAVDEANRKITDRSEAAAMLALELADYLVRARTGAPSNNEAGELIPGIMGMGYVSYLSGAAVTLDNIGPYPTQDVTLTANAVAVTLPPCDPGQKFTLLLRQDATAGRVPTLVAPAGGSLKYSGGGSIPAWSTTPGGTVDRVEALCATPNVWLLHRLAADYR